MYNKIFLPTDGSEHAEVALEHAIDLAQNTMHNSMFFM